MLCKQCKVHCMNFVVCMSLNTLIIKLTYKFYLSLQIVQTKASSPESVDSIINHALKLRSFVVDIYALGMTQDEVRMEIEKYRPQMAEFMMKHVSLGPTDKIQADRLISFHF